MIRKFWKHHNVYQTIEETIHMATVQNTANYAVKKSPAILSWSFDDLTYDSTLLLGAISKSVMPSKSRKLFVTAVWLLTAILCFWESYSFTAKYLEYRMRSKLTIEMVDEVRIPVYVFCYDVPEWNGTEFQSMFAARSENVFLYLSLIADTANDTLGEYQNRASHYSKYVEVIHFTRGYSKCIGIRNKKRSYNRKGISKISAGRFEGTTFHKNETNNRKTFAYFVSSNQIFPQIDVKNGYRYLDAPWPTIDVMWFHWQRHQTQVLEAPFETKCRYYNRGNKEIDSQSRCYEVCVRESAVRQLSVIPTGVSIFDPKEAGNHSLVTGIQRYDQSFVQMLEKLKTECMNRHCNQIDCVMESFHPYSNFFLRILRPDYLHFRVIQPMAPEINIETFPSMTFNQLMLIILNSFSFWTMLGPI